MKRRFKTLGVLLVLFALMINMSPAQTIEERIQSMVSTNAELYVTPLVTAFGSGLNSGWFHSAKPHKLFGFDIGLRAMAVTFPKDQQSFNFDVSGLELNKTIDGYPITLNGEDLYPNREVPTFFGSEEEGVIEPAAEDVIVGLIEEQLLEQGVSQTVISQPDFQSNLSSIAGSVPAVYTPPGTGMDFLPLIVPQVALGLSLPMLPIKAEIVARGIPEIEVSDEIGKFNFYGGGAKLALDPFIPIPMFPVDIAVGAYFQKMTLGKVFESNHSLLSLQAGKELNMLVFAVGVYGGIGLESSNVKVKYTYMNENDPHDVLNGSEIKFDMKGENKFRTTVGARVRLAVINVSADYSMGADNILTIGAGFSIR
ncbi:MAG TPA: hypothetical protein DHW42_02060 [Candidatus Marinimicrobia bacterium]|nr:hypothetical protein [Candidatus Neomarinimicrobiota bacterium]